MDIVNREIFSNLTIFPPIFVRLDGRAFHRLTRTLDLKKPFDQAFHASMCSVCRHLLTGSGLAPVFAYTFSDEISLYFKTLPFSGRVEKIDSVTAAIAASALTIELGCTEPLAFDARIIPAAGEFAIEYLISRQNEAWRNHINAYCQNALIEEGMTPREAAAALRGMQSDAMHEMMFARGVNLAATPAWQRRGTLLYRDECIKEGYNPLTGETVQAARTCIREPDETPLFLTEEGRALIRSLTGA
ncbi:MULTISPECIES: tRNA(His) guanylyltransferase Thg1 family protein [Methanoculleus]|jgi:tRNA(His) guanylyltransferase|uniref:tRNA(His) guanylyltransferase n=1 Tax=Methanoculleus thermophilus TaxID=2200 RepID=A0A1G8ZAQ3_9EURY|nr:MULTISPECIES: tRNA(His) guanylyltransferase Thg1 family protein [Methanoculleus]NLN08543.1 tRNA 5'-guanylyltransferase [Methanoculleus thermophilus]SDK11240.1 tRNA(His) 5'-end guanylyltransferase [Methanoculleus thermophilus]HQD26837.1 tRNA(His) guanylyltransferase Thg1 family protein [Methanoculleus thermophilus]